MAHFTPLASLGGGLLIGAACAALWLLGGRLAGVSGIATGLVAPGQVPAERRWRAWFVAGLLAGGLVYAWVSPAAFAYTVGRSTVTLAIAGLLVGVGTRVGGGCTSGHGICGVGRFSPRSVVATAAFIAAGMATVFALGRWS